MKIAVTFENGQIYQHFGHTAAFLMVVAEGGRIVSSEVVSTQGSGHGALAGFLVMNDVDAVICGGIGPGAQQALASVGIRLYAGCGGDAIEAARALAEGRLPQNAAANCGHHAHDAGHACGAHGCGEHEGEHGCGEHGCGGSCH